MGAHRTRHEVLHRDLLELLTCFLLEHPNASGRTLAELSIHALLEWSEGAARADDVCPGYVVRYTDPLLPRICAAARCREHARWSFVAPGRPRAFVCSEHLARLYRAIDTIGIDRERFEVRPVPKP